MNFSSILIVTYGRSGSTLLQGILNAIPGVLARGENFNLAWGLFLAYRSLRTTRETQGQRVTDPRDPFYGAETLDESQFLADARALLERQILSQAPAGTRVWGFKEIRYVPSELKGDYPLASYLDFLSKLMPAPAVLVLTREHEDVARSGFWQSVKAEDVKRQLRRFEEASARWADGRSDVLRLSYEALCRDEAVLQRLHDFLGAPYDPSRVREILDTPHSYTSPWRVKRLPADGVREAYIDGFPPLVSSREPLRFVGVVLLDAAQDGDRLVALCGGRTIGLEWHLPSPAFASRFPQDSAAKAARFRLLVPPDSQARTFDICLQRGSADPKPLLRVAAP